MNTRRQFLKSLAESVASGAVSAAAFLAGYWLLTGSTPSVLVTVIAGQVVTSLWGVGQAARFRRKWQAVEAAYNRPALGEGIEIPHRPPLDEPPYYGHVVDYAEDAGAAPECVDDWPGCESEGGAR